MLKESLQSQQSETAAVSLTSALGKFQERLERQKDARAEGCGTGFRWVLKRGLKNKKRRWLNKLDAEKWKPEIFWRAKGVGVVDVARTIRAYVPVCNSSACAELITQRCGWCKNHSDGVTWSLPEKSSTWHGALLCLKKCFSCWHLFSWFLFSLFLNVFSVVLHILVFCWELYF